MRTLPHTCPHTPFTLPNYQKHICTPLLPHSYYTYTPYTYTTCTLYTSQTFPSHFAHALHHNCSPTSYHLPRTTHAQTNTYTSHTDTCALIHTLLHIPLPQWSLLTHPLSFDPHYTCTHTHHTHIHTPPLPHTYMHTLTHTLFLPNTYCTPHT